MAAVLDLIKRKRFAADNPAFWLAGKGREGDFFFRRAPETKKVNKLHRLLKSKKYRKCCIFSISDTFEVVARGGFEPSM